MDLLDVAFRPGVNPVVIKFIRHSPGRRRSSETSMYDVCSSSKANADSVKLVFSQYRRRENPVPRPPELKDINVYPLVSLLFKIDL